MARYYRPSTQTNNDMDTPPTTIYAITLGRMIGIYWSWHAVEQQTTGYAGAKQRKYGTYEDAYRAVYGEPWTGPVGCVFVCHPDGWLALVDPAGDVPAQLAELAPVPGPPEPNPDRIVIQYLGRRREREIDAELVAAFAHLDLLP